MEKEILLKEIENTNHLNDLYQLWNEFKAYLENQPSLLELGQLFGFNYHLQEKFNQLSQLFIQEKKYQESIEFHQDFINYFKDDKYLCPFFKNLALSYFYQDNDQGISYFQELLERYPYDYEIMDAYFSCLYKQNNLQELKNMIQKAGFDIPLLTCDRGGQIEAGHLEGVFPAINGVLGDDILRL